MRGCRIRISLASYAAGATLADLENNWRVLHTHDWPTKNEDAGYRKEKVASVKPEADQVEGRAYFAIKLEILAEGTLANGSLIKDWYFEGFTALKAIEMHKKKKEDEKCTIF